MGIGETFHQSMAMDLCRQIFLSVRPIQMETDSNHPVGFKYCSDSWPEQQKVMVEKKLGQP